jgi:LuxR family transcriptional regulator, activator of conjugal transfer of Ti plasmids
MKKAERAFREFIDAVYVANTLEEFHRVGEDAAQALGFQWFCYFEGGDGLPTLLTSFPKRWVDRYRGEQYQDVDPVLRRARRMGPAFTWDARDGVEGGSMGERRFFADALAFDIRAGVTVPIAAGYGRFAAFTLAADDRISALERLAESSRNLLQMMGFTYHAHVKARMTDPLEPAEDSGLLTIRERQCLGWASAGKTMQEMATILGVTPRVVKFHLDNGRKKLGASTLPHAVALALRRELLP